MFLYIKGSYKPLMGSFTLYVQKFSGKLAILTPLICMRMLNCD